MLKRLFILLIIGLITLPVHAQSDDDEPLYLNLIAGEAFLEIIRDELASLGIEVVFQIDVSDADFFLLTAQNQFQVRPIYPAAASPSPMVSLPYIDSITADNSVDWIYIVRGADTTNEQYKELSVNTIVALILYHANRCDLALPYFERAIPQIEAYTNRPSLMAHDGEILPFVHFYQGSCHLLLGNYEQAAQDYEISLDLDRRIKSQHGDPPGTFRNPVTGANLAWTYVQLGREAEAFTLLADLLEESPLGEQQAQLLTSRAQLHALTFDYDAAIADMTAAIELDSDNPALYVLRGQMIILLYEWDRVLADYNTALEIDPDYADAYYYRALLYYTQQSLDQIEAFKLAQADLETYLALAPEGQHAAAAQQTLDTIIAFLAALTE